MWLVEGPQGPWLSQLAVGTTLVHVPQEVPQKV